VPDEQTPLARRRCVACEGGVPPLGPADVETLLGQLGGGWRVEEADGHQRLTRSFRFPDFLGAVDFVNRITPVAEAEGHHPDLLVRWGRVVVWLWTHVAGGLTENDFILAAKIDEVARGQ